jgi:biopolymer transport protein ExbD
MHATSDTYGNTQNQPTPVAEINTTPLVDVMLVLLIIFMITAPQLQNITKLKLAIAGPVDREPPKMMLLAIEPLGNSAQMTLDGTAIGLHDLGMRIRALHSTEELRAVNLRINPHTNYEAVTQIIATLNRSGAKDIRFDELSKR